MPKCLAQDRFFRNSGDAMLIWNVPLLPEFIPDLCLNFLPLYSRFVIRRKHQQDYHTHTLLLCSEMLSQQVYYEFSITVGALSIVVTTYFEIGNMGNMADRNGIGLAPCGY